MSIDWTRAPWRKASYSGSQQACVEVAPVAGYVGVRDTKDRDGGRLAVTSSAWAAFVCAVGQGRVRR